MLKRGIFSKIFGLILINSFIAGAIVLAAENLWSFYSAVSSQPIFAAPRKTIVTGLGVFALLVVFSALISFYFSRKTIRPLKQLMAGSKIIGAGNFDYRIKMKTGDEIEELATTLNEMAQNIKHSRQTLEESTTSLAIKVKAKTRQLRESAGSLEEKVKERTKELQERIDELERFQKLTRGRELRMIELKKKIKELEKKPI